MLKTLKGNQKRKKKGFTLIELIIVMAIMAILAAIAIPGFNTIRGNARINADKQSCETIRKSVLVLIADGSVTQANKSFTVTDGSAVANFTYTGTFGDTEKTAIQGALKEVKKPQVTTVSKFNIAITAEGEVTVTTAT